MRVCTLIDMGCARVSLYCDRSAQTSTPPQDTCPLQGGPRMISSGTLLAHPSRLRVGRRCGALNVGQLQHPALSLVCIWVQSVIKKHV